MNHITTKQLLSMLLISVATLSFAATAPQGAIKLQMSSFKEVVTVQADGTKKTTQEPITTAIPGDTIIYTTTYTNISQQTVDAGSVIVNKVPNNTRLILPSVQCDNCTIKYSISDRNNPKAATFKTLNALNKTIIKQKNGQTRTVTSNDFTLLQWHVKNAIDPAASGRVSYKVKIKAFSEQ